MNIEAIIGEIEKNRAAIATHRDRLRDILNDLESVTEAADDAVDSLYYVIDRLSEQV